MIVINMFSSANKVAGQGVGAVYTELMGLLKHDFANEFQINVNRYNTIDPKFYLSTFSKKRGRKIGFVHFVPSTLDASLKLPRVARWTLDRYTLAFYKRMDELVVVNPNFIPKLEAYGINPDKVTYIPNFVSQRTFHPVSREKRQALRHANGFKPDDFVVFGAGQVISSNSRNKTLITALSGRGAFLLAALQKVMSGSKRQLQMRLPT